MSAEWHKVADVTDIPPGEMLEVTPAGKAICLYNLGGEICATAARCTHGDANLADGMILGDEVECPFHQGLFDIRSGRATASPCTVDLKTYPVQVRDDSVLVHVGD